VRLGEIAATDTDTPSGSLATMPLAAGSAHHLNITIEEIEPPIWRRLLVPSTATLGQLHTVIQESFGWLGYHLHSFEINGVDYGPDDHDFGLPMLDENRFDLATVAAAGSQFVYIYDFGDDWRHRIDVEDIVPLESGTKYPRCVDDDEQEALEPAGSFDPAKFDLTETNQAITAI
jgi:hypothetical protein